MDTSSIFIDDLEIPTSSHPEIKKLKRKYKGHSYNGNRVWNSTLVLIDIIKSINILIQKNSTVLDIGTGWGVLSSYLSKQGADVTGVDIDEKVKPFFNFVTNLNNVNPKFINKDIFSKDFDLNYDYYIACDVCFRKEHSANWVSLINKIVKQNKKLLMCDPGRKEFWNMIAACDVPHVMNRHYINKPREGDSFVVIFGN